MFDIDENYTELSLQRKGKIKAAVLSLIEQEEAMKNISENNIENAAENKFINEEFKVSESAVSKKSKEKRGFSFIPAVAAAAAIAVALPAGISIGAEKGGILGGAGSSGVDLDLTSGEDNSEIVLPINKEPKELPVFRCELKPLELNDIIFNDEVYDINEKGFIEDTGDYYGNVDYDNTFKARGYKVSLDDDGGLVFTETDEGADIYYYQVEFSPKVQKCAIVNDLYGNVRVVLGDKAEDVHIEDFDEQYGGLFYTRDGGHWASQSTIDHEVEGYLHSKLMNGGEVKGYHHSKLMNGGNALRIMHDEQTSIIGRQLYKEWYAVNEEVWEIIVNSRIPEDLSGGHIGELDLMYDDDGNLVPFMTDDWDAFMKVRYAAYGLESPYRFNDND